MEFENRAGEDGGGNNPSPGSADSPPVSADVLPYDPEAGGAVVTPDHTPDIDYQDVPANVLYQLVEAENAARTGLEQFERGVGVSLDAVSGRVEAALGEGQAVTDAVAGSVLARADDAASALTRICDRAIADAGKRSGAASDDLRRAGVDVPYDPGVWAMMLDTPPPDWLPHIVPEIGAIVLPPAKTADPVHDCNKYPDDPACQDQLPPPDGGGVCLPVDQVVCWDGTVLPCDKTFNDCPPKPPPVPPIPPPVECPPCDCGICPECTGTGPTCPPPVVNCPTPGPVYVNVPPPVVVLPPPTAPGPPDDSQCPPPPDVNVTVNVPSPADKKTGPIPEGDGVKAPPERPTLDWKLPYPCPDLDTIIRNLAQPEGAAPGGKPGWGDTAIGWVKSYLSNFVSFATQPITFQLEGFQRITSAILAAPGQILAGGADATKQLMDEMDSAAVPNPGAAAKYGARIAAGRFAETHTNFPMSYLMTSQLYAFQYANPQYIPTQTQIDSLYIMDRIDDAQWQCWTMAQGNIPEHARLYRDTLEGRPTLDQLIHLLLRKDITKKQFEEKVQKIGWRNATWVNDVFKLATQIPTQTDLLRMMVRDSFDDDVAKKYEYDNEFKQKFTGKGKDWSEAQGIPEDIFKYFWRAHWVIPSNTQLYEMFHRLRPDRAALKKWDEFAGGHGEVGAEAALGPRPPVVTLADVEEALKINDQAPFWVPRQIAISYHPITRTDAVRAFQIGAFSEEQLLDAMMDNGYDRDTSELLVDFYKAQTQRVQANATGVLTIRKIVKFYKAGAFTRTDAFNALEPLMKNADARNSLLGRVDDEIRAEQKQADLKVLKRQWIAGEFDVDELVFKLGLIIADAEVVARVKLLWVTEKRGRLREPTAMMLCKWYNHRVINAEDYIKRLERLGYTPNDAEHIAAVCDQDMRVKLAAAAKKRQKELDDAADKERKRRFKITEQLCHPRKPCWDGSPAPLDTN